MNQSSEFRAVYVISVAAQLAGVHPQTLRNYERSGLLDPSRTAGGSRRYSDIDLARLRRIQELTDAGLNLEGVKRVLMLDAQLAEARAEIDKLRQELYVAVAEAHRHYRRHLVPVSQSIVVFGQPNQNMPRGRS